LVNVLCEVKSTVQCQLHRCAINIADNLPVCAGEVESDLSAVG